MRLQTILNYCQNFKSFVYTKEELVYQGKNNHIRITVRPRKNSRGLCSICSKPAGCYDHLPERMFEFVPLWGIPVYLCYRMRRVNCPDHGVKVEPVPWTDGKYDMTNTLMQYLAGWAKKLTWLETARSFNTSWHKVFSSVKYVVEWGLKNRQLEEIESIGVDEIAWKKGHKYLTLVYQIDSHCTRLLWVGRDRTIKTFLGFFRMKRVAKTIRKHKPLILNWFKAKKAFSSGIVEGLNNKVKVATRKAYGFRTLNA